MKLNEFVCPTCGMRMWSECAYVRCDSRTVRKYLAALGWHWTPTMHIGSGCTVHLRPEELPGGRLIVALSKHLSAVVNGTVLDTHDPSRDGTRCVYGYWQAPDAITQERTA